MRAGSRRFEPYAVYDTADHNAPQLFPFNQQPATVVALKLNFPSSTDFFGRVTIYNIDVAGTVAVTTSTAAAD